MMLAPVIIAVVVVGLAFYLKQPNVALEAKPVVVRTTSANVEDQLAVHKALIGADFPGYRNHIYRVLAYSLHYLGTDGTTIAEVEKYLPIIENALVYHDIGLWTDKSLAYLEPSSSRASEQFRSQYTPEELELLHNIIYWHHKITPFVGAHANIVNAVRKADWIDATQGLVNQGMPRSHIATVNAALPAAGFYDTLAGIGPRYYGNDVVRIVREMTSILKW